MRGPEATITSGVSTPKVPCESFFSELWFARWLAWRVWSVNKGRVIMKRLAKSFIAAAAVTGLMAMAYPALAETTVTIIAPISSCTTDGVWCAAYGDGHFKFG